MHLQKSQLEEKVSARGKGVAESVEPTQIIQANLLTSKILTKSSKSLPDKVKFTSPGNLLMSLEATIHLATVFDQSF